MGTMLEEALFYARKGWYVFPCREKPGSPYVKNGQTVTPCEKSPYTANGLNDATTDEDQIKKWWGTWSNALIGVNAGRSNLFVIDIDKKNVNGFDTYSTWDINDVAGLRTITPSGGMHIIFTGQGKTNTNATTGIDTRGEGGYFIAPPSKILEGDYCGEYKRSGDWSKAPGVIPDGLMEKLFPESTTSYSVPRIYSGKIEHKQLSRATLQFMSNGAPEGMRNATLFKALADFAGCGYSKEEARELVAPVSDKIGLSRGEFEQVLDNAYSKNRTPSIPEHLQEKIASGGKDVAKNITFEEQSIIEYAVLSCAIIDNQLIPVIADIISYEDFQSLKNKYIFQAMLKLYLAGSKADFYTIPPEIEKNTSSKITLDDITRMVDNYFINTDNIVSYVNIIKERASIRRLEAILDNKENYLNKDNFVEMVSSIEKDIADVALEGGAKSTSMLNSEQAVDSVKKHMHLLETGQIQQLHTGFSRYDNMVGGLYSNELVICAGRAGDGKCLKKGTLVIMHDGSMKKVEDIVVGDMLMGVDSKPRKVLNLSSGIDMLYTIKQNRAQDYTVNSKHILSLKKSSTEYGINHGEIVNIPIAEYLKSSKHFKNSLKGYKVGVEFPAKPLPIEPYFLGIWLGDGTSAKPSITTDDHEVAEYIINYANSIGMTVSKETKKGESAISYRVNGGMLNLLRDKLNVLNNKHIPFDYLTSSRNDRLQLLAGLIDTDGSIAHNGYEITQKNSELLKQIKWLADSLGFRTSQIKEKICTINELNFSGTYYRITIHGQTSEIPVKISRKKIPYINKRIDQTVTGIKVVEEGIGEYYGFEVDQDGLFLLEDFTVTHNSALALSIVNYNSIVRGNSSAIFSLEMSTYETICRLICQMTGIPFRQVYQGKMTDEQWRMCNEAMEKINQSNIYFDEGVGMSVREIRSKIRRLVDKGVSLIVIDQLEQIKGYEGMPAYVQFDKIAYDIKNLTLEFNIPIILNHQLNRNITNRALKNPEPQLADLNQAGEKPANQVWAIVHKKDVTGKILQSKIKVLKNRNGPRFDFSVVFLEDRMLFGNPITPEQEKIFYNGAGQDDEDDNFYSDVPGWAEGENSVL